jgi:hypothetical protein
LKHIFLFNRTYKTLFAKFVKLNGETRFIQHSTYTRIVSNELYVNAFTGDDVADLYELVDDLDKLIYVIIGYAQIEIDDLDNPIYEFSGYEKKSQIRSDVILETKFFINNVGKTNNIALFPVYYKAMARAEGFI